MMFFPGTTGQAPVGSTSIADLGKC